MTEFTRATTTRMAFNICHPDIPLQANDPRYVDLAEARGGQNFAEQLAQEIDWSQDAAPPYYQRLFTGHRGCGKTTELLLLKKKLEDLNFLVVYLDVEERLDLDDIEYFDLLLGIMNALFEQAKEAGLGLSGTLLKAIYDWFKERVLTDLEQSDLEEELKTEASGGFDIPFVAKFFAGLTAKIKVGSSHKMEIRQVLKRDLAVFIDRLNTLIKEVRKQAKVNNFRDVVIIADGLEKMPFDVRDGKSTHEALFVDSAERLKAPECHLIYTVPISLAYNTNLRNAFGGDYIAVMPMVNLSDDNCALFKSLLVQRIDINAVFESPDLVDELVKLSGGALRDLMRLVRVACQGSAQIGAKDVARAKNLLMLEYDRLLREEDFEILEKVHQAKQVTADDNYARLLHWRALHEYLNSNGERWADVHPLVLQVIELRDKRSTNVYPLLQPIELQGVDNSKEIGWGEEYPLNSVFVRTETRSAKHVIERVNNSRYNLNPEFQRDFVWSLDKQSRLIESCLMRIPLPVFYVAEAKNGSIVVVDGLQRLTTFVRFLKNEFGLKLGTEDIPHTLQGKYFKDLAVDLRERIEDTQLTFYILDAKAPERAKLDIFERVNSGEPLTRQQMRNCLYDGQATAWLRKMAQQEIFLIATGESLDKKTMRDREIINRFCAFKLLGEEAYGKEYKADMDRFLADTLEKMNAMDAIKLADLENTLQRSLQHNYDLFNKNAFRKSILNEESTNRSVINIALFDVCSVLFSELESISSHQESLRQAVKNLLVNDEFIHAITYSTNSTKQVLTRFRLARAAFQEALSC